MQNPLCATDGVGDEKCRFLGFRTFASREKGPPIHFCLGGSGPGRLWSEAATLTRACRVAFGGPSPRTPPEKVRAEGSRERGRGSRDSRRDVAIFLIGIQRVARLHCFLFHVFAVARRRPKKEKCPFRKTLFTPCYGGAQRTGETRTSPTTRSREG